MNTWVSCLLSLVINLVKLYIYSYFSTLAEYKEEAILSKKFQRQFYDNLWESSFLYLPSSFIFQMSEDTLLRLFDREQPSKFSVIDLIKT